LAVACIGVCYGCQRTEPPAALAATQPERLAAPSLAPAVSRAPAPSAARPTPIVLPSSAPSPAAPVTTPAHAISRVLVLGDSLTDEKVGGGGFVRILREHCPQAAFDNRAKGGFMVNQIRKRLETEVLPEGNHYSHAIVFGGVNDLYSDQSASRSLERIESDLSRIYDALEARSTDVIAITVTPWGDFKRWFSPERSRNTLTLNDWILARPAAGAVASAVDAYPLLSCGDPERLCPELAAPHKDGLHFGKLGHQKLARALLDGPFQSCKR
jgi:lysophospholipase L1-like esterase